MSRQSGRPLSGLLLLLMLFPFFINAQLNRLDTLVYIDHVVVPHGLAVEGTIVQEISGIEYTGNKSQYLLMPQTVGNSYLYLCSIQLVDNKLHYEFDGVLPFNGNGFDGESVRKHPLDGALYLSEETSETRVCRLDEAGNTSNIYKWEGALRRNSGFEGLCFSATGAFMYVSLERSFDPSQTIIVEYSQTDQSVKEYTYPLDLVPNDLKADNGVTELLWLDDGMLLVVERAFLGKQLGTSVRVYKVELPHNEGELIRKVKCLTDFRMVDKLDNIEGVAVSASGRELLFISDNNGRKHQQTQIVAMAIH